jgi:hypothetical protein
VKFLRRFLIRLSNFATGRRADQRVREEMAEHLALQTEENLRAGMSPAEARRQAALKLGAALVFATRERPARSGIRRCGRQAVLPLCRFHLRCATRDLGRPSRV